MAIDFIETSKFFLFRKETSMVWQDSRIKKSIREFLHSVKNAFRYSFLSFAITFFDSGFNRVLNYSRFINLVFKIGGITFDRIDRYTKKSLWFKLGQEIANKICLAPVRTTSSILVIFLLSNLLFLSLSAIAAYSNSRFSFIKPELNFFDWAVRGILLILGIVGISYDVPWEELKKTSIVIALSKQMLDNGKG